MSNPTRTPISPPTVTTSGTPPPLSTSDNPISPVSRTATFPHKTSPGVSTQTPLIDTNTPAINDAPVELDGVCVGEIESTRTTAGEGGSLEGEGEGEKRAAIIASRAKDPGVIVDLPGEPTAEEVLAAKRKEGVGREVS